MTPESAISLVPEEEIWHTVIESVGKEPVDVLQDIRDIVATTGGDAIFEAEIRINVPGIDVQWFKEEKHLTEGDKYHIEQKGGFGNTFKKKFNFYFISHVFLRHQQTFLIYFIYCR